MLASEPLRKRGVFDARVLRNDLIRQGHYRLVAALDYFPPSRPGQFVQLRCRPAAEPVSVHEIDWPAPKGPATRLPVATQGELTNSEPTLRRPISIADRRDGKGVSGKGVRNLFLPAASSEENERMEKKVPDPFSSEIEFVYRVAGAGTRWLSGAAPGDTLSILGPLGNGFTLRPEKPFAALVGGGVGIPPMLYLAHALADAAKAAVAFCGARSADLLPITLLPGRPPSTEGVPLPCVAEFAAHCADAVVATDDGSAGVRGLVSEAFLRWFTHHDFDPRDVVVYACGPEAMMRAVGGLCLARDIECQLALERHMACGMGTCQSCVVKIRYEHAHGDGQSKSDGQAKDWSYKLCCTDGPVFHAGDVLW